MSKNYKLRLIKTRESYTSKRISQELNVHQRTVQEWFKTGLKPIENKKPYLVMGYELKFFLERKQENKKCKLSLNQFYCTKCRHGVMAKGNNVEIKISSHAIGKNGFKAMTIKGICEYCNSKINRFSHTGNTEEIQKIFNVTKIGGQDNE